MKKCMCAACFLLLLTTCACMLVYARMLGSRSAINALDGEERGKGRG